MGNAVYNLVCSGFDDLMSRRAAESLVQASLAEAALGPDRVTAEEMAKVLRQGIFRRLQKVVPVPVARQSIRQLLDQLPAPGLPESGPAERSKAPLPEAAPPVPQPASRDPRQWIAELAKEDGVTHILLCQPDGALLDARLAGPLAGDPSAVAVATLALLERRHPLRLVYLDLGELAIYLCRLRDRKVLAVLASASANTGSLLNRMTQLKEA